MNPECLHQALNHLHPTRRSSVRDGVGIREPPRHVYNPSLPPPRAVRSCRVLQAQPVQRASQPAGATSSSHLVLMMYIFVPGRVAASRARASVDLTVSACSSGGGTAGGWASSMVTGFPTSPAGSSMVNQSCPVALIRAFPPHVAAGPRPQSRGACGPTLQVILRLVLRAFQPMWPQHLNQALKLEIFTSLQLGEQVPSHSVYER